MKVHRITISVDEWGLCSAQLYSADDKHIATVIAAVGMTQQQFEEFLREVFR